MSDKKPDDMTRRLADQVGIYLQPDPVMNETPSMHDLVMEDLQKRKEFGLAKYGTLLQAGNGRKPLQDAYEEILDLAVYLKQAIIESEQPNIGTAIHRKFEEFINAEGVGSSGGDPEELRDSRQWRGSAGF